MCTTSAKMKCMLHAKVSVKPTEMVMLPRSCRYDLLQAFERYRQAPYVCSSKGAV